MYHIKLHDYVPEPQAATSDRIVAAHYYAAWKKGAAEIHGGFDDLHGYPERTPLMGYYDEENPEVCDWEIKWALEHGINCFIYCWYRRLEHMGKPVKAENLRCGHCIHDALFGAKYGDMMKFAIMFENSPRWGTTDENDIIENLMPFWIENYFSRSNYLKIDNKPVLFIFYPRRLEEVFGSAEKQKKAFDSCREYARNHGFDGMIFACCDTKPTKEANDDAIARGYDFRFGYNSGYAPKEHYPPTESIIEGQISLLEKRLEIDPERFIPTVSCFSDPAPRTTRHWIDMGYNFHKTKMWYLEPDDYRKCLKRMKEVTEKLPDGAYGKRIMMIDNWNEWDEGHYVAPSHEFGFRYLQAIREELTERDNLPDYRTPQDIGLSKGLNTSWEIPNLEKISMERLDKEKVRSETVKKYV